MENYLSAGILGFREGLEAFLIIAVMIQYLTKINQKSLIKNIWYGVSGGVILSLALGYGLSQLDQVIANTEEFAGLWEAGASFVAVILVSTFIVWMIKNGSNMVKHVESQVNENLSTIGITLIALVMVSREGAEIAIFTFAGEYSYGPILIGILISLVLTILIYFSLARVNLKTIFNLTLGYLILQAGFMLGYSIHEGSEVLKELGYISDSNPLFMKAYNFKDTILDHKNGIIGLPLYVTVGWYSRPEWLQFIVQYGFTISLFTYWYKIKNSNK